MSCNSFLCSALRYSLRPNTISLCAADNMSRRACNFQVFCKTTSLQALGVIFADNTHFRRKTRQLCSSFVSRERCRCTSRDKMLSLDTTFFILHDKKNFFFTTLRDPLSKSSECSNLALSRFSTSLSQVSPSPRRRNRTIS